jgi:hypothetical protein
MKTEEDEAFDELAKRQGMWGGGFQAKRAMAVDKLQEPVLDIDGHVVGKMRKPKPAQEPVALADLVKEAQQIVKSKFLWKKFIDGTPLANDIAFWMADFAQQYTTPPKREWVGLIDTDIGDEFVRFQIKGGFTQFEYAVRAIEAKLKEKNNE